MEEGTTAPPRWLLLIHQVPPRPNYLRVKLGRQLHRVGAVALKNSVYALPRSERNAESFAWIAREVRAVGGEATVCESRLLGGVTDDDVERLFHQARDADYGALLSQIREVRKRLGRTRKVAESARGSINFSFVTSSFFARKFRHPTRQRRTGSGRPPP